MTLALRSVEKPLNELLLRTPLRVQTLGFKLRLLCLPAGLFRLQRPDPLFGFIEGALGGRRLELSLVFLVLL